MTPLASQLLLVVIVVSAVVWVVAAIDGVQHRREQARDEHLSRRHLHDAARARARADLERQASADLAEWEREVQAAMRPPYDQERDQRRAS